jgi:hypothetical protein
LVCLLGEVDDVAALSAVGQVRKGLLLLVCGQSVLGEGAELVGVGVLAGLDRFGH